jgi:hypothetical protein
MHRRNRGEPRPESASEAQLGEIIMFRPGQNNAFWPFMSSICWSASSTRVSKN